MLAAVPIIMAFAYIHTLHVSKLTRSMCAYICVCVCVSVDACVRVRLNEVQSLRWPRFVLFIPTKPPCDAGQTVNATAERASRVSAVQVFTHSAWSSSVDLGTGLRVARASLPKTGDIAFVRVGWYSTYCRRCIYQPAHPGKQARREDDTTPPHKERKSPPPPPPLLFIIITITIISIIGAHHRRQHRLLATALLRTEAAAAAPPSASRRIWLL